MSHIKIVLKLAFTFLLLISYFLLPNSYSPTFAQDPDYDRINEIAKNLNCPTCTGINLADCRTLTCEQWRDQINDLVEQGYSDQEVLDYFATRYGTQVLQEPPKDGSTLFLWVLPVIVLLAGGGWLIWALWRWARPEVQPVSVIPQREPISTASQPSSQYLSQVEKDLHLGD
ncbi:MAG: cytochrome c-type biogenesis protein CcmH [Anaerolineae bacterium]|nr:cytochrome c-type biogenesis protein CcmH [Anaerolineae bacterium]